ncbi:GT-D fold domain-containing protein [Paenibacillus sp. FSL K6-2524]|uniref:GT-D fold domain-containing protein n=1 Tax=Paenibacillus sp. FSL K6-2524 TaxID=2954516 RepID=UPI0030FB2D49
MAGWRKKVSRLRKTRRTMRVRRSLHPAARSNKRYVKKRARTKVLNKGAKGPASRSMPSEGVISESLSQSDLIENEDLSSEVLLTDAHIAAAYEEGYRQGYFEGGEAKVGQLIPPLMILPELTVDDLIATGYLAVASTLFPLIPPAAVYDEMKTALDQRTPLSLIRLGDGELLTLAHDIVIPTEQAVRWGYFLPYAGINLPDPLTREALANSLQIADLIGVPESRHPSYQGLLFPILRHYGIDYRKLRMTSSVVNYTLNEEGFLSKLLVGRKILIIGNEAPGLSMLLEQQGFQISGIIHPVQGVADVSRVMEQTIGIEFDIALVAAGVAAVLICTRIAKEHGKVSFDLGHLANKLESGEVNLETRL